MSSSVSISPESPPRERENGFVWILVFIAASLLLHVVAFTALGRLTPPAPAPVNKPVELVMIEVEKPPPPEPEKVEEPPKKVKPPPVRVAEVKPPPAEKPKEELPPPPNETPPPETPPKPVPLVVGISMSSTTSAGSFPAPVGNTTYGKTENVATAPTDVKGYSAPKYMPVYQVDTQPEVVEEVKEYPDGEAKRLGVEGTVVLKVVVDTEGRVAAVKVVKGLGYGLDEVAIKALKRFRFKPAMRGGEPVSTEIPFRYTFELD